jgi:ABC-type sugar transport system ATPase subunit
VTPFLEFRGISRRFPGVQALDGVSFGVERGSCHGLIGENGAGKSTLGKILAGIHPADDGEMVLEGRVIRPATPLEARALGIAIVHQELSFCPNLTVAENLCLGDLPANRGWIDRTRLRARARAMLHEMGSDADPEAAVGTLSPGREQQLQIAAAVGTGARVIVMDEPTSALSAGETRELRRLVRELKARGITILYISHRMEELFQMCDAITVLRDGRQVSTEAIGATNPGRVVTQMIGRALSGAEPAHLRRSPGGERLGVEDLASPGRFSGVNFSIRSGEIVGIAGLVGAGRSEILEAIFGLDPKATGIVRIDGREVAMRSVSGALGSGMGFLPEDRKRQGLVLTMNVRENCTLAALPLFSRAGWMLRRREREIAAGACERLRVKAPSLDTPVAALSGGNQQKITLAKWVVRSCEVLLVDEPTRGVDVGAKAEIHRLLDELACKGKALLVVSSELPELLGLCSRILVMRAGRLVAEVARADFSEATLMRWMAGLPG